MSNGHLPSAMDDLHAPKNAAEIVKASTLKTKLKGRKGKDGRTHDERGKLIIDKIIEDIIADRAVSFTEYSKEIGISVEVLKRDVVDVIKRNKNSSKSYAVKYALLDMKILRHSRFEEKPIKQKSETLPTKNTQSIGKGTGDKTDKVALAYAAVKNTELLLEDALRKFRTIGKEIDVLEKQLEENKKVFERELKNNNRLLEL